jgi:hypothetical protein
MARAVLVLRLGGWVVPVWVCDWGRFCGSVMPPHHGAGFCDRGRVPWAVPACKGSREPPHPLAAGRADAARGERTPPGSSTKGPRGPFSGAGLTRSGGVGPRNLTIAPALQRVRGPLSGRVQMALHLLQSEAAVDSVWSPTCAIVPRRHLRVTPGELRFAHCYGEPETWASDSRFVRWQVALVRWRVRRRSGREPGVLSMLCAARGSI